MNSNVLTESLAAVGGKFGEDVVTLHNNPVALGTDARLKLCWRTTYLEV